MITAKYRNKTDETPKSYTMVRTGPSHTGKTHRTGKTVTKKNNSQQRMYEQASWTRKADLTDARKQQFRVAETPNSNTEVYRTM
jgi:hypothetical protein